MGKIHLEVEQGRSLAQKMNRAAGELFDSTSVLNRQISRLSGAWTGGGAEDFIRQARRCISALEDYADQFEQLAISFGHEIDQWVAADADGVGGFAKFNPDIWGRLQPYREPFVISGMVFIGAMGSQGGGGDAGGNEWEGIKTIDGHTEYFLINGEERRYYEGYREGDISFKEMVDYIVEDPFENEMVKGKVKIWESEGTYAQAAWRDAQASTTVGLFTGSIGGSLLSAEAAANKSVEIKDGSLQAKGEFEAGAYLAKGTCDAQLGALGVAAVGYIGANVQGEGGIAVNPLEGDLGVTGEFEAFAGGKIEGEADLSGEIAGVDVSGGVSGGVSYGVGVTAKADVGMDDWNLSVDLELGATLGLGAEVGLNFEVNVQEAATAVVDFGKEAVDFFF